MAKILIVSDTHGDNGGLIEAIATEKPFDLMVHCGDCECSEGALIALSDTPVYVVEGNNDYFYDLSIRCFFEYQGIKILVTHGHYDKVYYNLDVLLYRAKEMGAQVVLFGHTHVPCKKEIDGITFLNPGSLTYPRQAGREPSYIIMEVENGNILSVEHKFLT